MATEPIFDNELYAGFSSSSGPLQSLIRVFTNGVTNHSFLTWQDAHLGWLVIGANQNGVTVDTWTNFTKSRKIQAIFKPVRGSLWDGLEKLKDELNEKYDIGALVGMSIVEIADRWFHTSVRNPLDFDSREVFCSEFQTQVIRAAGFEFLPNQWANTVSPQDAYNELSKRVDFVKGTLPSLDS